MTESEEKDVSAFVKNTAEKMGDSSVFLGLFSKDWEKETAAVIQMGLAMLLDKPIAILALDDQPIPENLKKVAFFIRRVNGLENMEEAVKASMDAFIEYESKLKEGK